MKKTNKGYSDSHQCEKTKRDSDKQNLYLMIHCETGVFIPSIDINDDRSLLKIRFRNTTYSFVFHVVAKPDSLSEMVLVFGLK